MTAEEIRQKIIDCVSNNGGHLASSLGAVEIAMALADVFDPEKDRIVWDVGHQAYAWKILTGRADGFSSLRRLGGISPFPTPLESRADPAVAGHAGTAVSVAEGLSAARDLRGSRESVVTVTGDGSIVNGTSFEALNCCAAATGKVIVVLNDNGMAISKPAGSISKLFAKMISAVGYNRFKAAAEAAGHRLRLTFLRGAYCWLTERIKGVFLGSGFFEHFGLRYIGPVDGHDLDALRSAFTVAKENKGSVLVHVVTKKGKGFLPAEEDPVAWHGVGPFGGAPKPAKRDWSAAFGDAVSRLAESDGRIVALTAGMTSGTGLERYSEKFPSRFFDVGISEGHMVAFAAGLASGGMRPVVAVYSTFLQRAIDQVMHDVCIANLPVVFCVDRAGVVGADGATHQGVFDLAMLRCLPNLTICQPKDEEDLCALLAEAVERKGPTVIRYPRGEVPAKVCAGGEIPPDSAKVAIWSTGDWFAKSVAVARRVGAIAVHARYLKPFDEEELSRQRAMGMKIVSIENGSVAGGFGEMIGADMKFGWPDEFIVHGTQAELEKKYSLDEDSIVLAIEKNLFQSNIKTT